MLRVTRKLGEEIVIGNNIVIKVLAINSGQVCLGIAAPDVIPVHRREIYNQIKERGGPIYSLASKNHERAFH